MKQVILNKVEIPTIELSQVYESSANIIAYETSRKTGLAVLGNIGDSVGFIYHSYLVCRNNRHSSDQKYQSSSRYNSILKALEGNRTVLVFESFSEFLAHAVELEAGATAKSGGHPTSTY